MALSRILSVLLCLFCVSLSSYEVSWAPPVEISLTGKGAHSPQVAVNGNGDAVAVWVQDDGVDVLIYSSTRAFGGNWSAPVSVSLEVGSKPQVAINEDGNVVAVWVNSTTALIQASTSNFGGSWSTPVDLSTVGQSADNPQVVIDSNGNAIAIWQRSNGLNVIIQASTLPFGGSWSAPVDVSTIGVNSNSPQIGVDENGNAVASWSQSGVGYIAVQASTLPFGGSWSAPIIVSAPTGFNLNAQIAVDQNGNAVLTWQDGLNSIIQAATLPFGGSWSAPVNVSAASGSSNKVAVDGNGNAVAVWLFLDTDRSIQASFLPFGGSWSTPVDISTVSPITNSQPSVAINESGEIVVAWEGYNGLDPIVQASTAVFGGSWSAPVDLSDPIQPLTVPDVGIDDCGNPVVVWRGTSINTFIAASSGTKVAAPQPPTDLLGSWKSNRFVDQKEYINCLTWKASDTSCIDILGYRVYVDGILIGFVSADDRLFFEIRRRKKNRTYIYSITSLGVNGLESAPISIALKGG